MLGRIDWFLIILFNAYIFIGFFFLFYYLASIEEGRDNKA